MRACLLAACLSLSLTACGNPELSDPAPRDLPGSLDSSGLEQVHAALAALPSAQVMGTHSDGLPFMIRGELGPASGPVKGLEAQDTHERLRAVLTSVAPVFRLRAEELVVQRVFRDELGYTHLRYAQTLHGLPVFGHELILHVDALDHVYAANGSARGGEAPPLPAQARMAPEDLQRLALASIPGAERVVGEPRLQYARAHEDAPLQLVQELVVEGSERGEPVREHVFLDALDGSVVLHFSQLHRALNRSIYSTTGLVRTEGSPATGDVIADTAYDNLGRFYNCYKTLFNRDSYDGAGAPLTLRVHYQTNYNGIFWDDTAMMMECGDGNGITMGPSCSDPDVVIHELAHEVTARSSNLIYSGESGGLSESLSDIAAAVCASWGTGTWSTAADIWKFGEQSYTPSTAGDAVRYMDDPSHDGISLDYYPDYTSNTDPHYSSGISNLAFALLSKGGTHPQGKTTNNVVALGVDKAAQIFYRANSVYLTSSANFAAIKTATENAARDLYGSAITASVTSAWQAVGVGTGVQCPALANGVALTGLSGAANSASCAYPIAVPAGATNFKVEMSGGTGDADLYVKADSVPTASVYDCRPYLGGNVETCNFTPPSAGGVYYIVVRAFAAYSGVSLKASFTVGATYKFANLSGAASSSAQLWSYPATAGHAVTFTIAPNAAGSTGDADLYVKFGSAPTVSVFDCRPYTSSSTERCTLTPTSSGVYYVSLRGYSAYTGVDLTIAQ